MLHSLTVHSHISGAISSGYLPGPSMGANSSYIKSPISEDIALNINTSTDSDEHGRNRSSSDASFNQKVLRSLFGGEVKNNLLKHNQFSSILKNNSLFAQRVLHVTQQPDTHL